MSLCFGFVGEFERGRQTRVADDETASHHARPRRSALQADGGDSGTWPRLPPGMVIERLGGVEKPFGIRYTATNGDFPAQTSAHPGQATKISPAHAAH